MGTQALKKIKRVGLDTNVFSYQFHQDPTFGPITKPLFDLLSTDQLQGITSIVTLIEILSVKAPRAKIRRLEDLFSRTPNLEILDVDHNIATEAAEIRRKYGFRLPDAIQLATAKFGKAKAFITNDQRLKVFKDLKVVLLSEIK